MNVEQGKKTLERFPRLNLGIFPTPIATMENLQEELDGNAALYIKRDDLTGLGAGGNKIRNLEYLLGDAVSQGADVIIASGKSQSNLCALTVSACSKAKLDCIIVHNDEKPAKLSGNQLLNHISGADIRYIGEALDVEREEYVLRFQEQLRQEGRHPYIIQNGASTAVGALGYVQAMVELCEQCAQKKLTLDHLFIPGGNGGLAAGAIFGAALVEAPFHLHVITVEHKKEELEQILKGFLQDLRALTGVSPARSFDEIVTVHGDYRGAGWGKATDEAVGQIYDLARTEGIYVEKVYTSKTLYGMMDLIKRGEATGNVCYLHSGGFAALFSQF